MSDTEAEGTRSDNQDGDQEGSSSSRSQRFGDGIKQGVGVLSAFKDALEETIQEARERGDLSSEKAKQAVREALDRAQTAAEGAREKLDFAHQSQIDGLREAVESLGARVAELERAVFGGEDSEPEPEEAAESNEER